MAKNGKRLKFAWRVAVGDSIATAARKAGVPTRSAYRWSNDAAIKADIEAHRRQFTARTLARLTAASVRAADKLARLVKSSNERIALLAARAILELRCKMFETEELDARLRALEERASESHGRPPYPQLSNGNGKTL